MARRLRLFFATDVHGSERCFRKFLNGGAVYGADAVILGGDIAGKAIQAIDELGGGRWRTTFRGRTHDIADPEELARVERMIGDLGYYPWRCEPGALETRVSDGSVDELLLELMSARLEDWMALADERLRPRGIPAYWMLGNDDPPELAAILDAAPWGEQVEGRVVGLGEHELVSWGYSNPTPWDSYREMTEEALGARFDELFAAAADPHRVVFNAHVPPYDSGLDTAPVVNEDLVVQQSGGQVVLAPVGSSAVRAAIERWEPIVSLHGHCHESPGFRRIGSTLAVNPGSDYGTGELNGAILTLSGDKLKAHQLVRG